MNRTLDAALDAFADGGDPESVVEAALAEADAEAREGRALAAMARLVRAERALAEGFGGVRGSSLGVRHVARPRVHALLRFRERVDARLPELRRTLRFPEDTRAALELEVERGLALSRAFVELGWYANASGALARAELPLDYLGEDSPLRFAWLRQRASWGFAARELEAARAAVRAYVELAEPRKVPEGELEALTDELADWLEVAPVRALVAKLSRAVAGRPELEGRILAWDLASTLFFPWDEAFASELEDRLREPTVPLLEALVDRVGDSLAARAVMVPEQSPRPALVEDGARVLALLDRLAELAHGLRADRLAETARVIAHEQMLDVLSALRGETDGELHPIDAQRIERELSSPPWSVEARSERLARLRSTTSAPSARALAAIGADPLLPEADAVALASTQLVGPPDEARLDIAAALLSRASLLPPATRDTAREGLAVVREWLEGAVQVDDVALAAEAKEILAGALELSGELEEALSVFEELATYFESRDHDRWVHAIERCAMLAKSTGRLAAAGRAARSGFRPGGRVQAPAEDLPSPEAPLQAEEHAERAIAVALRTTDPDVGEAWLRRALALYERVPDGRRREDELWERIADLWQAEADALFESGDASSEELDEAHRRAHEALVRAIEVNEDLGDGERVFELSGRVLDVLWTWLTRWEDAVEAFLSLARGRFQSAIQRGDLDHAVAALFELRAHLGDFHSDASVLGGDDEEARALMARFEMLEQEMTAAVELETARLGEPWWGERLERRAEVLAARFGVLDDEDD